MSRSSDLPPEIAAVIAIAERRRKMAAKEAATGKRGPISDALQDRGITLGSLSVEAVLEMMYWDGVKEGLRAAHSESRLAALRDLAFKFPGFEDR